MQLYRDRKIQALLVGTFLVVGLGGAASAYGSLCGSLQFRVPTKNTDGEVRPRRLRGGDLKGFLEISYFRGEFEKKISLEEDRVSKFKSRPQSPELLALEAEVAKNIETLIDAYHEQIRQIPRTVSGFADWVGVKGATHVTTVPRLLKIVESLQLIPGTKVPSENRVDPEFGRENIGTYESSSVHLHLYGEKDLNNAVRRPKYAPQDSQLVWIVLPVRVLDRGDYRISPVWVPRGTAASRSTYAREEMDSLLWELESVAKGFTPLNRVSFDLGRKINLDAYLDQLEIWVAPSRLEPTIRDLSQVRPDIDWSKIVKGRTRYQPMGR